MKLNQEQCLNLPFPIGCPVWYDIRVTNDGGRQHHAAAAASERREYDDDTNRRGSTATKRGVLFEFAFKSGIVSAAYLDIAASNILYEITPANGSKMNDKNFYSDNELLYGAGSPVVVRPGGKSCNEKDSVEHSLPCEVLLCRLERDVGQELVVVRDSTASCCELNSQILGIKQRLLEAANNNDEEILNALCSLNNVAMSIELLRSTEIGKMVSKLKNSANSTVSMMAKELVTKWKEIANSTKDDDETPKPVVESTSHVLPVGTKHSSPVFSYTVKVPHGDGTFHIEDNIAHNRVKYHHNKNVNQTDHQGIYETELTNHSAKQHDEYENEIAHSKSCRLTSPSTLTNPDIALDQFPSDVCSQPSSPKRKLDHQEDSSGRLKRQRSCDGPVWTPPKGYVAQQPGITPKQLYTNNLNKECVKIPLEVDHIPWIVGTSGMIIKDIEQRSGCTINIRGRGTNEPSHAELIGDTNAIKTATELIQARVQKLKNDEFVIMPLRPEYISRILGYNGQIINDIKIKSGCRIFIRGEGTANDESNQPPYAKIVGNTNAIKRATVMIDAILRDGEEISPRAVMQESDDFTTIPLRPQHIERIIGKNGSVIKEIEMKTRCQIDVPKREHRDKHSNELLQVKIYGKQENDVEAAVRMINDRISDIERSDQIEEQMQGVAVLDDVTTLPLRLEQISRIVGRNGGIVKEIERNSGCQISIRGKGSNRVAYRDEPLHARIAGGSPLARENALKLVLAKISSFSTP